MHTGYTLSPLVWSWKGSAVNSFCEISKGHLWFPFADTDFFTCLTFSSQSDGSETTVSALLGRVLKQISYALGGG